MLYGSATGVSGTDSTFVHQGTDGVLDEPEAGDELGWALASADVDGDGHDDLVAGAPGETVSDVPEAGLVHVFAGSATGIVIPRFSYFSK